MINWSKISNHSFLGRCLRLPLRLIPKQQVVPILAGPCRGMRWISGSSSAGCWLGSYEKDEQKALATALRPGMVVYDIGANAGIYTLLFSKKTGPEGRVFAFEPFPENITHLVSHIRMNALENVTVVPKALSGTSGTASFSPSWSNSMGRLDADGGIRVLVTTLDEVVEHQHFPPPDLVKMDVEGAEADVLSGAAALLKRGTTVWFISLHGTEQQKRCFAILHAAGYRIFSLLGRKTVLTENEMPDDIYAVPENHPKAVFS